MSVLKSIIIFRIPSCKRFTCCAVVSLLLLSMMILYLDNDFRSVSIPFLNSQKFVSETEDPYVQRYTDWEHGPKRKKKVILVWTTYFGSYSWTDNIRNGMQTCASKCDVTHDRNEIRNSDAVLFHFTPKDLKQDDIPKYRKPYQVWCIHNNEPNPYLKGSLSSWNNVFNWTVTYRGHSTIRIPYGTFQLKQNHFSGVKYPPFEIRNRSAYAVISHCSDDANRYRLVNEIQKYIPVDHYGRCGNMTCEVKDNCLTKATTRKYKFRLAFENSNCREYVTEKYWYSLRDGVIPVVNWKSHQKSPEILPNTYINVYDFPDVVSLVDYLKLVSSNKTLYNSYFDWQSNYTIATSIFHHFCQLCVALYNTSIPPQVYTDLDGWLQDDTCSKFTYLNHFKRIINRFMFDGKT